MQLHKLYLHFYDQPRLWHHSETIIYPFGLNQSQKKAVENALSSQVSIIQGPPGTGKTQTILNILANLVWQDKTALVVSNNNSATKNVADKLADCHLDFLVAALVFRHRLTAFFLATDRPVTSTSGGTRVTRRAANGVS